MKIIDSHLPNFSHSHFQIAVRQLTDRIVKLSNCRITKLLNCQIIEFIHFTRPLLTPSLLYPTYPTSVFGEFNFYNIS